MKIRLKNNYWKKKEEWQYLANLNLWIIILQSILITITLISKENWFITIFFTIMMTLIILPQKISYHYYKKEQHKIFREQIIKEAQQDEQE